MSQKITATMKVLKKSDGYWLSIEAKNKALIYLGKHGKIVTAALEEVRYKNHRPQKVEPVL